MTPSERIRRQVHKRRHRYIVFSGLAFLVAALVFGLAHFRPHPGSPITDAGLFLLLVGLLACVLLTPAVYLAAQKRFSLFHPLVYPVIFYLFPVFIIGSLTLISPLPTSWIVSRISDPNYYLNLSLVYIAVGSAGLVLGYATPFASKLGRVLNNRTPQWSWSSSAARVPGLLLFAVGTIVTLYSYALGVLGYQIRDTPLLAGGTVATFAHLGTMGAFILWHSYFRRDRGKPEVWAPILVLLLGQVAVSGALSGSRYTLLSGALTILAAYHFSGGRYSPRLIVQMVFAVALAILLGFAVGTAFRDVKGSEEVVPLEETFDVAGATLTEMATLGAGGTLDLAVDAVLQRLENLSSFAVIVSNYERLRPLEQQYGIAGNIWTYTWTAFIPRFIWPDKPLISDARAVGALYFSVPTNSFAMTVFGDLLRNFGPIGIPLGMMLLGFMLRILWSALIGSGPVPAWHAATYYLLLTSVNYESFYGTIIPGWVRVAFVCLLGGLLANVLARAASGSRSQLGRHARLTKAAE